MPQSPTVSVADRMIDRLKAGTSDADNDAQCSPSPPLPSLPLHHVHFALALQVWWSERRHQQPNEGSRAVMGFSAYWTSISRVSAVIRWRAYFRGIFRLTPRQIR